MPGVSGVTVVTTLVCFFHFAREAAGASRARHSLRPLIFRRAERDSKTRAHSRREIAKLCRQGCSSLTSPRLRGEVGDEAIAKSPGEGDYREFESVESPPHPLAAGQRKRAAGNA